MVSPSSRSARVSQRLLIQLSSPAPSPSHLVVHAWIYFTPEYPCLLVSAAAEAVFFSPGTMTELPQKALLTYLFAGIEHCIVLSWASPISSLSFLFYHEVPPDYSSALSFPRWGHWKLGSRLKLGKLFPYGGKSARSKHNSIGWTRFLVAVVVGWDA